MATTINNKTVVFSKLQDYYDAANYDSSSYIIDPTNKTIFIEDEGIAIVNGTEIGTKKTRLKDEKEMLERKISDAEAKIDNIADLATDMIDTLSYGIWIDLSSSSPELRRSGNLALHGTLPIQSKMVGVILDDYGNEVMELPSDDWTSSPRDGSQGQVMVRLPEHYIRYGMASGSTTVYEVRISEKALPGFTKVPKRYVSAYEAALDFNEDKIFSAVNIDFTSKGFPSTGKMITSFRDYAWERNHGGDTKWNIYTYDVHKEIYWLFVIEYATLNVQKAVNAELTANGWKQGGLGAGVTTLTSAEWIKYNNSYPFVPCGYTDSLGNGTGEKAYLVENADKSVSKTVMVPRYRGIENPFGHIEKMIDGITIMESANVESGGTGITKIYTCSDPAKYNNNSLDGYEYIGDLARNAGYIKKMLLGDTGSIMATETGGSSTTYYCDNHTPRISPINIDRIVSVGGSANNDALAGLTCVRAYYSSNNAYTYIGTRLCYITEQ